MLSGVLYTGRDAAHKRLIDLLDKNEQLPLNIKDEVIYYVDYIFKGVDVSGEKILDIAFLSDLWGQGIDESLICIEDLKITKSKR